MRLPSIVGLVERSRDVVQRFPWTVAAGAIAAAGGERRASISPGPRRAEEDGRWVPGELPPVDWSRVADRRHDRDSTASRILAVAGMRYFPEWSSSREGYFYISAGSQAATADAPLLLSD